jgi:hypothetical protein
MTVQSTTAKTVCRLEVGLGGECCSSVRRLTTVRVTEKGTREAIAAKSAGRTFPNRQLPDMLDVRDRRSGRSLECATRISG